MRLNTRAQGRILMALLNIVGEIPALKATGTNDRCQSTYTRLGDILHAIKPTLAKHQVMVTYSTTMRDQSFTVQQRLIHVPTGETLGTKIQFRIDCGAPHEIASLITYARRYLLASTLNLELGVDDDGQQAQATAQQQHDRSTEQPSHRSPSRQRAQQEKQIAMAADSEAQAAAAGQAPGHAEPTGAQSEEEAQKKTIMTNLYIRLKSIIGGNEAERLLLKCANCRFIQMVPSEQYNHVIAEIKTRLGPTTPASSDEANAA